MVEFILRNVKIKQSNQWKRVHEQIKQSKKWKRVHEQICSKYYKCKKKKLYTNIGNNRNKVRIKMIIIYQYRWTDRNKVKFKCKVKNEALNIIQRMTEMKKVIILTKKDLLTKEIRQEISENFEL